MSDYQPTEEDIQFLNDVDHGYIGLSKPNVNIIKPAQTWQERELERQQMQSPPYKNKFPEQDNWAGDPEQAWA